MENLIEELKYLKSKSTPVNNWYPHTYDGTVRGPWNRWFKVLNPETIRQEGTGAEHTLPPGSDDVNYCAAAMNAVPQLVEEIERLKEFEWKYTELCK